MPHTNKGGYSNSKYDAYAAANSRNNGVYPSSGHVQEVVKGYSNADMKGFNDRGEARGYVNSGGSSGNQK
ncbi:hypothetical protein DASC09_054160 [Saccharomycopsis crataegensis]|uniref:Ribonuclease H1 N-terminal domain-containing protein n=1 Tax=Saccharomycopsis crataegensis TaxID=43959 RepID=A0AAV5QU92_9ASCO|nr:hypothetical protein DASC09_054160 [Saccharomycopsis crataegensis]